MERMPHAIDRKADSTKPRKYLQHWFAQYDIIDNNIGYSLSLTLF
jgi:hypothetical protein